MIRPRIRPDMTPRTIARVPCALVAAVMAGCAPTGGANRAEFIEPPAMERTIAIAGVKTVEGAAAWPGAQWWRAFRNSQLNSLVERALDDNQSLRKAADTLRAAEANVELEGSRLTPFVEADLQYRQYRYAEHGVAASLNPNQAGLNKSAAFLNPLSAKWEIDFWGKNRALLDASIGEARAKAGELEQTQLLIATGVARAYLRGYMLANQLKLASEIMTLRREVRLLAETRYQAGLDTLDNAQLARLAEETAVRRVASLRAAISIQENALARLIGQGPDATRGLFSGKQTVALAQPALPKRLPVELLIHRPDLAAALHRAEAAAERIHVAKTLFLPSIDLSVSAGVEASTTSSQFGLLGGYLFAPGAMVYNVAPGLHLPIFQGGKLSGNLEASRSEYDQAVDVYNETLLAAAQQVADALANLKRARTEYASQTRFVARRRTSVELARTRLREGLRDRRETIQEYADLLDARLIERGLEGDRLVAAVDLFQALGGGYADGPRPSDPKPAPEADPITPVVDTFQYATGG